MSRYLPCFFWGGLSPPPPPPPPPVTRLSSAHPLLYRPPYLNILDALYSAEEHKVYFHIYQEKYPPLIQPL